MKHILIIALLFTLVACSPSGSTTQPATSQPAPILTTSTQQALMVSTATNSHIFATLTAIAMLPSKTPIEPTPAASPACTAASGDWSTTASGSTLSIMFTIQDCRITAVFILGSLNGQWITVSNEADQPITGPQFDLLYSFSDQDRYHLSGTFTSPTTADIQMVIFKGFRFTTGQPSPLNEDLIINATANP